MKDELKNTALIILAGGKNSRYNGDNKAFIKYKGKSFISWIMDELQDVFDEKIIVTNSPGSFTTFDKCKIVTDIVKSRGPLAGIHAGLSVCEHESAFVISCDMPLVDKRVVKSIIEKYNCTDCDGVVPDLNNETEPLFAVYSKGIIDRIVDFLDSDENNSVKAMLKLLSINYYTPTDVVQFRKSILNINSPKDFEKLIK